MLKAKAVVAPAAKAATVKAVKGVSAVIAKVTGVFVEAYTTVGNLGSNVVGRISAQLMEHMGETDLTAAELDSVVESVGAKLNWQETTIRTKKNEISAVIACRSVLPQAMDD